MSKKGANPTNSQNKLPGSRGGGYSPPSGKFGPPEPGAHAPKDVHKIKGDHGGPQNVHHSLHKPGLMS